jgi:hypothetical protein
MFKGCNYPNRVMPRKEFGSGSILLSDGNKYEIESGM